MNAALLRARQKAQTAIEDLHGGRVTIGGATLAAAVVLGSVQNAPKEDGSGWEKIQTITVRVLKTRLLTAPAKKTALTYLGADYLITSIGGNSEGEPAWLLQGTRRSPAAS